MSDKKKFTDWRFGLHYVIRREVLKIKNTTNLAPSTENKTVFPEYQ